MRDLRGIISPNQEIGQAGPGKTTHPQRPTARLNSRGMPSDSESSAEPASLHSLMHLDAFVRLHLAVTPCVAFRRRRGPARGGHRPATASWLQSLQRKPYQIMETAYNVESVEWRMS